MSNRIKLTDPPATRAVVEALVSTLDPAEPLPRWARNPRNLAEFTAGLIARGVPHEWRGGACDFALRLHDGSAR